MRKFGLAITILSISLIQLTVSGCSNAKRSLGLEIPPPDEFTVLSRPPLEIPPNFDLRPPKPGESRPQEKPVTEEAKSALLSTSSQISGNTNSDTEENTNSYRSSGEQAFLKRAVNVKPQPDIRDVVDAETSALTRENESFTNKLIFWKDMEHDPTATVVDAAKETKRINTNKALGNPLTEGETPIIKNEREGILEGVFD